MICLLSPAKTLDFSPVDGALACTRPDFLGDTSRLVKRARELDHGDLRELMGISDKLAELNHQRFREFKLRPGEQDGKPAALAFQGDVYQGLDAASLAPEDLAYAQEHVRILSGLYGVLRPLDRIQPYRLEMGSRLENERGKDLYAFWGDKLARAIDKELKGRAVPVVVNLASGEYFKAVDRKKLKARVVTPVFKEIKDGQAKVISFVAKRSRGMMARWLVQERIEDPEQIKDFDLGGYRFMPTMSDRDNWEFQRPHETKA